MDAYTKSLELDGCQRQKEFVLSQQVGIADLNRSTHEVCNPLSRVFISNTYKRVNYPPLLGIKNLPGKNFIPSCKSAGNTTSASSPTTFAEKRDMARLVIIGFRMERKRPIQKKANEVQELDQSQFENEVLNSTKPVLVGFLAAWSKPCQLIGPVLEEVAQACHGKSKVFKVNVDDNLDLASTYGIQSVPTLNYFINGVVRLTMVGMASPRAILAKLEGFTQAAQPTDLNGHSNNH
ncbi:MAG TPA: thioredoxin domain-containing protein [Alphaproteobacteria bacterium]|nr:thioredoxin domain-containing protein [Alphaproteobacteria bacterium]